MERLIEWAKNSVAYQKRIAETMRFNKEHGISNEMYRGVIGINNRSYMEGLCNETSEQ